MKPPPPEMLPGNVVTPLLLAVKFVEACMVTFPDALPVREATVSRELLKMAVPLFTRRLTRAGIAPAALN